MTGELEGIEKVGEDMESSIMILSKNTSHVETLTNFDIEQDRLGAVCKFLLKNFKYRDITTMCL